MHRVGEELNDVYRLHNTHSGLDWPLPPGVSDTQWQGGGGLFYLAPSIGNPGATIEFNEERGKWRGSKADRAITGWYNTPEEAVHELHKRWDYAAEGFWKAVKPGEHYTREKWDGNLIVLIKSETGYWVGTTEIGEIVDRDEKGSPLTSLPQALDAIDKSERILYGTAG